MQDHDQSKSIAPPEPSRHQHASPGPKVGDVRRIPHGGPVYEVIAIVDDSTVRIQMIESGDDGEICDYPIADFLEDLRN